MPDVTGLGLLVGHLAGDYLLQNDHLAAYKAEHGDGKPPAERNRLLRVGRRACLTHCLLYTLCVWACSFTWMPWWGLVACFGAHYAFDRYRLAGKLMRLCGQTAFASPKHPLFPWSIVVVDNTWHLITLYLIAVWSNG